MIAAGCYTKQLGTNDLPCISSGIGSIVTPPIIPHPLSFTTPGDLDVEVRDMSRIFFLNKDRKILSPDTHAWLRDKLLIIHGPPDDGSYSVLGCGNMEQSSGTPQELLDERDYLDETTEDLGHAASWFARRLAWLALFFAPVAIAAGALAALIGAGAAAPAAGLAVAAALAGDAVINDIKIPETENHRLMIESSRFLKNQIIIDDQPHHPNLGKLEEDQEELKRWLLSNAVISAPNVTLNRARLRFNDAMPVFSRSGQVDIVDSEFEGNTSGSVFRGCNHARIVRTSFTNNSSKDTGQGTGGGAFSTACATDVENSTFTGNTSKSNGGAIRIRDTAARVSIRGSRFSGNIAVAGGGAIAVEPSAPPHAVVLQRTIFKGNSAQAGGALFFEDSTAGVPLNTTLQGGAVTFSGNTATDRGGAIAGGNATLDLSRSVFVRNAAQSGAAVWIDTPADRPSSFANSLFVLNKAPSGTFNGRAAHFVNSTILGSDGPGLVLLPPVAAGGPPQVLRLSNSIIENNSGGNCRADAASIVDDGGNLQFPGTTCGGRIPVAAALLDTFYAPLVGGPARAQGRDDVCRGPKVQGHDLYGKRRPQADHCSIGAVEGDVEQLILSLQAGKALRGKSDNCRRDSASRSARDCDDRRTDRRTTECLAADLTTAPRVSSSNPSRMARDGFPSAAEVLPPLFEAGIDFSVTKAEITDFLNNSRFTPYPAIASVLLTLTQARPLRCRVFLDVIVFNYENAPGAKSPRKVADVNLKLLRASIVEGYNNRYGTAHLAFENLLQ